MTPQAQAERTTEHGNEAVFARLVEAHRGELHAHCYRMLGSLHDAEDALQEAMLRAWRGLPSFEGRGSLRSWLYSIATNACLDAIARRPNRVLPIDYAPSADPHDRGLASEDDQVAPEARYEMREAMEIAFIAAVRHLPAKQRAVLILRDVLGFSAREAAVTLQTTVDSVNSAVQRARAVVEERLPERSEEETLRSIRDERLREAVESCVEAWERGDLEAVVARLATTN